MIEREQKGVQKSSKGSISTEKLQQLNQPY
jgi:hypothetical protein